MTRIMVEVEVNISLEEARDTYRAAWQNYLLTPDEDKRNLFCNVMDDAQVHCVSTGGPGLEWETFVNTLPGFREYWETGETLWPRPG